MTAADALYPKDPARALEAAAFAAMELNYQLGVCSSPWRGLVCALDARRQGRVPEWLEPVNLGGGNALTQIEKGRRQIAIATAIGVHLRGETIATLSGRARHRVALKDADAIVAHHLNRTGVASLLACEGRAVTARMVGKWRERSREYGKPEELGQLIAEIVKLPKIEALAAMAAGIARLR
jgi:hypothetical protein